MSRNEKTEFLTAFEVARHSGVPFLVRLFLLGVVTLVLLIGLAWAFGALWFDFPVSAMRRPLAVLFGLGATALLGVVIVIALVAVWELTIPPSNTRDWQPQVAEAPYVEIDGDRIVIHNFRNFDYFSKTDFLPRWETKTVHLSNLIRVAYDRFLDIGPQSSCHRADRGGASSFSRRDVRKWVQPPPVAPSGFNTQVP